MHTQAITFKGLTNNFSRVPIEKYSTMQRIQATAPENSSCIVGKMPQDILRILVEKNEKPQESIKFLFDEFSRCAESLQQIYSIHAEHARNFSIEPYLEKMFDLKIFGNLSAQRIYTEKVFLCNEEILVKEKEVISKAQERLKEAAKKVGLIPPNGDIKISSEGQGAFGAAFQLKFLDEKNQPIIHAKVMKIFPNSIQAKEDFNEARVSKAAFFRMFNDRVPELNQSQYEEIKEDFKKSLQYPIDTAARIKRRIKKGIEEEDIHGFLPETNRGLYINRQLGKNVLNTEFVPFYYADLKGSFFITELSDSNLPNVSSSIGLETFGLNNTDRNIRNKVCNRLIDYGGIQVWKNKKPVCFDFWEDTSSL